MDLYIYYRVRSEHTEIASLRVRALQERIARAYGIVTALKRRPEEKQGCQTWMEIYEAVPDGFEAALRQAVVQAGLGALIDGPRHVEHFLDMRSCA